MAINLAQAKLHLRVEHTDEDEIIALYIRAALTWLQTYTGLPSPIITDELGAAMGAEDGSTLTAEFPDYAEDMRVAALLIVHSFYTGRGESSIPMAAKLIANPYRRFTFSGA